MASYTNSILDTVKDRCDIMRDDDSFDSELITIINSELAKLAQLGVGPIEGIEIRDNTAEWDLLIGDDKRLNFVKDYMPISVRLVFNPPTSSSYLKVLQDRKDEYEWRLNFEVDPFKLDNGEVT